MSAGEPKPRPGLTFAAMRDMVGREVGVSAWITVDQRMIDRFAECTGDRQWIHVDVARAKRESPFGAPVAHGYLTLSLVAVMGYDIGMMPEGVAESINYGLDRVRFLAPVRAGSRVRLRSVLLAFDEKTPGRHLAKWRQTVEIEGEEKPALIAETLVMFVAG